MNLATLSRAALFACAASLSLVAIGDDEPAREPDAKQSDEKPASLEKAENKDGQPAAKAGEKKKRKLADSTVETPKSGKPGKQPANAKPVTAKAANAKPLSAKKEATNAEREEAVFLLLREHYPDLVNLLKQLKGTKQKEYQQAVRELYRDSQRLEAARRDPERYELEVRAWQLDSRIRLLTAKLSVEDRPELQEDVKAALAERADVRLAQKKLERERLTARIEKLEQEIDSLATNRDEELQRTFERLVRTATKARPKKKPTTKEKPGVVPEAVDTSPEPQNSPNS